MSRIKIIILLGFNNLAIDNKGVSIAQPNHPLPVGTLTHRFLGVAKKPYSHCLYLQQQGSNL